MTTIEHGELQVVVPVGFLLTEVREVTVSVDRPGAAPLPIRLRLIPARPTESVLSDTPVSVSAPTPIRIPRPHRGGAEPDGYGAPEYGGSD
jgi:hypothetical protein